MEPLRGRYRKPCAAGSIFQTGFQVPKPGYSRWSQRLGWDRPPSHLSERSLRGPPVNRRSPLCGAGKKRETRIVNLEWTQVNRFMRGGRRGKNRSEEHTSELQSPCNLVCRLLLEKTKYEYAGAWRVVLAALGAHMAGVSGLR